MLNNQTTDFLTTLESARTVADVWSTTAHYLEGLGFTHSIYTFVDPSNPDAPRVWTTMPEGWCTRYVEQKYQRVDPFFRYCCSTLAPIRTGSEYLDDYDFLTGPERRIVLEAGETGFRSGFSVPVRLLGGRGFGGWNFGSRFGRQELESLLKAHGPQLRLAGFYIHEHVERLSHPTGRPSPNHGRLTLRERECLLWLSRGLRTAAIAHRLGIAQVTVDLHVKGARAKLRAATREEALARAILTGQVHP
jgi:DNA-binding CsgD family transcriptional regulator